jgi:2-aminoadipate transaminase
VLLNEGDAVLCENPSFIGALNAFRSYNARLVGVETDRDGIVPEALEEALKTTPDVKLVYLIPTFQNPSGVTLPLSRRQKVLELCAQYGVLILEDDPYLELRYSGEYVPPIASMDTEGRVLYVGSYSKTISPGLRVGFAHGPLELINKMVTAKQIADVHTGVLNQMMVYEYIQTGALNGNIEKARLIYKTRRDLMVELLTEQLGDRLSFAVPDGGLFIWATLRDGSDGMHIAKAAGQRKVAIVPGSAFSPDESAAVSAIRLNFSLPNEEQIRKGVKRLTAAMNDM